MDDERYIELAEYIFFSENKSLDGLNDKLNMLHLQFRKNKGIVDINKAILKAKDYKKGRLRTELEIGMLSIYLKDIIKNKRVLQ